MIEMLVDCVEMKKNENAIREEIRKYNIWIIGSK